MAFFISEQSPEEIAEVYLQDAVLSPGPFLELKPLDDYSDTELRFYLVYVRSAIIQAHRDGVTEPLVYLLDKYDRAFVAMFHRDASYRKAILANKVRPLKFDKTRTRSYYLNLANAG